MRGTLKENWWIYSWLFSKFWICLKWEIFLTSYSSMCGERPCHGCHVCLPAHRGSQTYIWWREAEQCLDIRCWTKSQTDHPQTSVKCPVKNMKRNLMKQFSSFASAGNVSILQNRCTISSDSHSDRKTK